MALSTQLFHRTCVNPSEDGDTQYRPKADWLTEKARCSSSGRKTSAAEPAIHPGAGVSKMTDRKFSATRLKSCTAAIIVMPR